MKAPAAKKSTKAAAASKTAAAAKTAAKPVTVTLNQMAKALSESHEMPRKQTTALLNELTSMIQKHLKKGARVRIGGIGVRERVFQFLLGSLAGIPAGTAVSISLVGYLLNNSWGLVGAAVLPLFKGIIHEARTRARPLNAEG